MATFTADDPRTGLNLAFDEVENTNSLVAESDDERVALLEVAKALHGRISSSLVPTSEFLSGAQALSETDSNVFHIAQVQASRDYWHSGCTLSADSVYGVKMSWLSRWTLGRKGQPADTWEYPRRDPRHFRHFSETPVALPETDADGNQVGGERILLGFPWALVWHHERGPHRTHIAEIRPLSRPRTITTGPFGGSIHFYIPDVTNAYGDNEGHCVVTVTEE